MTNWKVYKLEDLCLKITDGSHFSPKEVIDGTRIIATVKDMLEFDFNYTNCKKITDDEYIKLLQNDCKPQENDILFSKDGTIGKIIVFNGKVDLVILSSIAIIRPNPQKVNPKYLGYFLKSAPAQKDIIDNYRSGSVIPRVILKDFKRFPVSIPDLPTQTAIAEILSSLDDKIELNNKINQELENLAQTLFKQWFIDFEFPNENGEPYKSSGGEMIDSELGEIPKEWEVRSLDEIADFLNGLALQKFPPQNEIHYLPVIKIRELRQGITEASDKASNEIPEKYIIQNGDVLFAWSGSLMIDFWTNGAGALNQHLFKVTSEKFPKWFYFYWTKYHLDEFIKIAESKATTMGHIQRKHLSEAKVTVPISTHLNQFNENFENIVDAIISNREEIQELSNLRDTLLPKLISGELEVSDALTQTTA